MELDAQTLKETYLGRVVLFYTKAPRVQATIKRQADTLVQLWSRPILRKPADLRGRKVMSERDMDLAPPTEDVEMGGAENEDGGERSQARSQARTQSSQGGSQKMKIKKVNWEERAQVNTTSKSSRMEKAQVSEKKKTHKRLESAQIVVEVANLVYRTSNTRSHQIRNRKVKIGIGMII